MKDEVSYDRLLLEMRPTYPECDPTHGCRIDIELLCYFAIGLATIKLFDSPRFALGELGVRRFLTSGVGAVEEAICGVLSRRRPTEMSFGNAALVTVAAIVGGLVQVGWRRTVRSLANQSRNRLVAICHPYFGISSLIARERPDQAFIAFVGKRIFKKPMRLSPGGSTGERIAVTPPSIIMGRAPATNVGRLTAFANGADRAEHAPRFW